LNQPVLISVASVKAGHNTFLYTLTVFWFDLSHQGEACTFPVMTVMNSSDKLSRSPLKDQLLGFFSSTKTD
jgi:hypothetical protein